MSATGFHPEPSAKAPWTRTMVLTAAYAGDDAARAAPVRRARIKRFMLQLHKIAPPHCLPGEGLAPTVTAGNYSRELRQAKWVQSSFCPAAIQRRSCSSGREPGEDQMGIPPIAVRSPKPRARLEFGMRKVMMTSFMSTSDTGGVARGNDRPVVQTHAVV